MKLHQIITSLLSTDLYKLSMGQAIYHQFSDYKTTWTFKGRNKDVHFTEEMVNEIKEQIKTFVVLDSQKMSWNILTVSNGLKDLT